MISPELLRKFPFFAPFTEEQLKEIALISEECSALDGAKIFEERQTAEKLCLLLEGGIDLIFTSEEQYHPKSKKEFLVGEINPGEIFGISSLGYPYVLNATARVSRSAKYIEINAPALRNLLDGDPSMGYVAMQQITKVLIERLAYTRVQLAAAWA
jgi:CRP-like cAMP-binding protein